jgi:hypothetical protein
VISRGDLVVVALCAAAVAASAWALAPDGGVAHSALIETHDGRRTALALARDARLELRGRRGPFTIEVRGGRARFLDSDCPQKLCVRAGWLSRAGESSACVPNGASLTLIGDDRDYDALTF